MDKKLSIKGIIKKVFKTVVKAVETIVTTVIDTAESCMKYYNAHKSTIDGLGVLLLGSAVYKTGLLNLVVNKLQPTNDPRRMTRDELNRRFYDARLGKYVYARRTPTPQEAEEIEYRYVYNKESYRSILSSMGILE